VPPEAGIQCNYLVRSTRAKFSGKFGFLGVDGVDGGIGGNRMTDEIPKDSNYLRRGLTKAGAPPRRAPAELT